MEKYFPDYALKSGIELKKIPKPDIYFERKIMELAEDEVVSGGPPCLLAVKGVTAQPQDVFLQSVDKLIISFYDMQTKVSNLQC